MLAEQSKEKHTKKATKKCENVVCANSLEALEI